MSLLAPRFSRPPAEKRFRVLVVDDDPAVGKLLARSLGERELEVVYVDSAAEALRLAGPGAFDAAIIDFRMPRTNGIEVLRRLRDLSPNTAVILASGYADGPMMDEAIREGAYQLLSKPFPPGDALALMVRHAAEHRRVEQEKRALEGELVGRASEDEIVGTSDAMRRVYRIVEGVASATSSVLVTGESGTGKELVARAIHRRSPRAAKPLVAINCGAVARELVESELFGHVRGAFTGAQASRAGLFETADGGTLFLDEVGELPLDVQVKLLRVLQSGEIRPVGADTTRVVDVRVIAATNVDLPAKLASGEFRRDLFYRLNVISIVLPPLRERGDDVILLAQHFLRALAARTQREPKVLAPDAVQALRAYAWPGNVRELENALERAFVLTPGAFIKARDLPIDTGSAGDVPASSQPGSTREEDGRTRFPASLFEVEYVEARRRLLAEFEARYVHEALRRAGDNLSLAARISGLDRSNFRRILRRNRPD